MKAILIVLIILSTCELFAKENQTDSIVKAIQNVCLHPSGKGEFWSVEAEANAGASIKILGSLAGNIKLNKEEWDGVRRVLPKDQVLDSNKYRDCVMNVMPIFIQNFKADEKKK